MTNANFVNVTGLMFDIAGAIYLGRAVVLNSKEKIAQQVATAWNYNRNLIPAVVEQRIDGIFGLALLVIGFGLQAASSWLNGPELFFAIGGAVLTTAIVEYHLLHDWLVDLETRRVITFIEGEHEERRQQALAKKEK